MFYTFSYTLPKISFNLRYATSTFINGTAIKVLRNFCFHFRCCICKYELFACFLQLMKQLPKDERPAVLESVSHPLMMLITA